MIGWAPLIEKGVTALAPELFKVATGAASKGFRALKPYETLNFDDHFGSSLFGVGSAR